MKLLNKHVYYFFSGLVISLMFWSCAAKKEDAVKVRFMKNVTAHYNIYFNAKELFKESELAIQQSLENDFNQTLEIFPVPSEQSSQNETGNLNEVIKKANTIALEKYESNWLDDAYLLLADAEYTKGDFYNAVEFYSYVSITFAKEKKNKLAAYLGQSKSDFAIGNYKEADSVLRLASALKYKYYQDKLQASLAQAALKRNDTVAAINYLEKAVKATRNNYLEIRWRYILAQLQEINNQEDNAYANYEKIVKSNASFEMSFNANLSRIRIAENAEGKRFDKIVTLNKLLKEDKNKEFKDQIYYQIGNAYADKGNLDKAIAYYKIASHAVPGTVKQKGLSYLKLAELNFDSLKNYTQAQLYYDSTLQYLPKNYPNYKAIAIKANNLQYLADRLTIIETQKQLLKFANLTDDEINVKVEEIIQQQRVLSVASTLQSQSILPPQQGSISDFSASNQTGGNFYFYNPAALSQGLNEFKTRWGQRKLTDNWRSNTGSLGADLAKNSTQSRNTANNPLSVNPVITPEVRDSIKANFVQGLPFSPASKIAANAKIALALYEIANFYKDILKDDFEAAEAYEAIVLNYPNDDNAASIYYQLFRLLEGKDAERSEKYKQQLLLKFPSSVFAKTISDSNFGKEEEFLEQKIKSEYEGIYTSFLQKRYSEVIQQITMLKSNMGSFKKLEPQFAYLQALAVGNTQKLPVFLTSLNDIVKNYPDDTGVTPTVKKQLEFIDKNKSVFELRPTALVSFNTNDMVFNGPTLVKIPQVKPLIAEIGAKSTELEKIEPKVIEFKTEAVANKLGLKKEETVEQQPVAAPVILVSDEAFPAKPKPIVFSENDRQKHLIIIDINDPTVNIAKPFSRVSQYFYSKFAESNINIVIRVVGKTDKFIIINGEFYSNTAANKVATDLETQLPKLLEGLESKYRKFVVSESNLKLLLNADAVEQYIKSISDKK